MISPSRENLLLDLLTESGNTGFWTYRESPPQFWVDAAACRLMHCSDACSLDHWLWALETNERIAVLLDVAQACASHSGFSRRVPLQTSAGEVVQLALRGRWLEASPSCMGELVCVVERMESSHGDVAEAGERHAGLLATLQASMAHLLNSSIVGMMVVELSGAILDANDYLLHLLQRSRSELDAGVLNWIEMTPPDYMASAECLRMHEQLLTTGCCPAFERPTLRPDGTVVHLLVTAVLQPGSQNRALMVALDLTDNKQAQAQLLELNAQWEKRTLQAERAEVVKTLFLSSISHELRTPMHTIFGYVRLLRKKAQAEQDEQLAIVERRGTHLLRLIDDLLEFNHTAVAPDSLRMDFVDMDGFVRSLEYMFSAMAEQTGNQFHLQLAKVLPLGIVQDEGRLVQILRILMDNACKYTTEGHITLSVDSQQLVDSEGRCRLSFTVQDTGRGIAEADVQHIFEPMRRGKNADDRPGLGLGLAIAEQWIQSMGSRIEVQSQLGVGSRFRFELLLEATFEVVSRWREPRSLQPAPRNERGPAEGPTLPAAELAMFGQLISMGRMGRLGTWARKLAVNHPELQSVADQVASLAAMAEVDALERLYRRSVAQAAGL